MKALYRTLIVAISIYVTSFAVAAPGDIDPDFNGKGVLTMNVGNYGAHLFEAIQQQDNKLVFVGYGVFLDQESDYATDPVAVRVLPDGTLDSTFGTEGIARADVTGFEGSAADVVQQADGKLVLAMTLDDGSTRRIALVRMNDDGTLDTTFGTAGWATLELGGLNDFVFGLVVQPNGKLTVAGRSDPNGHSQVFFAQFNSNGTIDTTFGNSGTSFVDFEVGSESDVSALARQPDGKLVAVGRVLRQDGQGGGIARVTADGALDTTFDADGRLAIESGYLFGVAIQSDDSIVAAGFVDSPARRAALLRFNADGSIDSGFGTDGRALINLGTDAVGRFGMLRAVVAESNGTLVATGTRINEFGGQDMILTRFHADGSLDASYGDDGVATADFGNGDNIPGSIGEALIQQSDGKYVAAGGDAIGSLFLAARFDDDAASPGLIGLTATQQTVAETDAAVTYIARRTGGKTGAVSVNYETTAGQAQPGDDFDGAPGTLSWSDGDASDKSLSISLINDVAAEEDEDFKIVLTPAAGGVQLAASEAKTVIVSEDGPGRFEFTSALEALSMREDFFGEDLGILAAVRRTAGSTGPASVSYDTSDGTATGGEDYRDASGTLTWADGEAGIKYVSVVFRHDQALEGNEDFQIQLSSPTGGATIDPLTSTQRVVILDDDFHDDSGFEFVNTVQSISEATRSVTLNVARSGPLNRPVSVRFSTSSGTADEGSDFTGVSGTLDWEAGEASNKAITIDIRDDREEESRESFAVTLSDPSSGAKMGQNISATVNITNDDVGSGGGGGGGGGGAAGLLSVLLLGFARMLQAIARRPRTTRAGT